MPAALILAGPPVPAPLRPCPGLLLLPAHSLFLRILAHFCDFKASSLMIRNESLSASWAPPSATSILPGIPRDADLLSDTSHVRKQSHHLLQIPPPEPLSLVHFKGLTPGSCPGRDAGAVLRPPSLRLSLHHQTALYTSLLPAHLSHTPTATCTVSATSLLAWGRAPAPFLPSSLASGTPFSSQGQPQTLASRPS